MRIGNEVKTMLLAGKSYSEIGDKLKCAKSTIAYHARVLGLGRGKTFVRQIHDWQAIQQYYDSGYYCLREVSIHFNIKMAALQEGCRSNKLIVGKRRSCKSLSLGTNGRSKIPLLDILRNDSKYDSSVVKRRIKSENIIPYLCSSKNCLLHTSILWNEKPIVLHLDHIDGDSRNHSLNNLRWLCPNCHSQTDTYCGRNKRKKLVAHVGFEPTSSLLESYTQPLNQ